MNNLSKESCGICSLISNKLVRVNDIESLCTSHLELYCSSCQIEHDLRELQISEIININQVYTTSKLISKLNLIIQDPYNYLHESIQVIKTQIDLRNEQEQLSDYLSLIRILDEFQSERKTAIDLNFKRIERYFSKTLDFSAKLAGRCLLLSYAEFNQVNDDINNLTKGLKELEEALFDHKTVELTESPLKLEFVDKLSKERVDQDKLIQARRNEITFKLKEIEQQRTKWQKNSGHLRELHQQNISRLVKEYHLLTTEIDNWSRELRDKLNSKHQNLFKLIK